MRKILELIENIWAPDPIEPLDTIVNLAKQYSSDSCAFVVFEMGTVVYSDSIKQKSDDRYLATLSNVIKHPPDFNVMPMNDGNFVVRFAATVTGIVNYDHYKNNRQKIVQNLDKTGLMSGEKIAYDGSGIMPNDHNYIGLYARAKVFKDICDPQIIKRYQPDSK